VTEHLCDDPFVDETLAALAGLGPEDLVVMGGGGLFMDYFEPFWKGFAALAPRPRYCVWGAGACDMKREPSRMSPELLEHVAAGAAVFVVRDELTRSLVTSVDLPEPVPCPSIVALAGRRRHGDGLLHVNNYDNVGPEGYERMRSFLMADAERRGVAFRETNNRIERDRPDELEANVAGSYEQSELVVASALHGCIIGLAVGCRVLAVSGDHKVESFMQAAGLGDWVLDVDELGLLEDRFAALPSQPPVDGFLAEAVAGNAAVAEQVSALATDPS
jgi:hypothetical protein